MERNPVTHPGPFKPLAYQVLKLVVEFQRVKMSVLRQRRGKAYRGVVVRPGGWILADNVLWDGKVCAETISQDRQTQGILAFNEMVAADPRVENVILPLRDGLNIIYKK